jgi:signal transduction histidine kinase
MSNNRPKILLIEGASNHAQRIEAMIAAENGNFETVTERGIETGIARLMQDGIDLVLLDLALSDVEGLNGFLKIYERAPDIPIVVLTTTGDLDLAFRAMQAGAHDYLIKGEMDHRLLQLTLSYTIERKRAGHQRLKEGQPVRLIGVDRDVTEKKRLEAEIYRAQRLESIGALASGIAHDLNNVLAPILMALHTLQQRFTDKNSQRWLSLIYKSTERGRDLVEQMIAFAKGASGERIPLKLNHLVEDLANILRETLPKDVGLEVVLPEDLWNITGDTTQIHQVLMNLCINARDSMPHGGRLTIKAENINLTKDDVRMHSDVKSGRFIRITVADTGFGISPQTIDRIFDPFFTTKDKGKGSGLGLSTVLGIVRGHGGFVDVQSEVSHGSQFRVHLPAHEITLPSVTESQIHKPHDGNGELILIVDDEPDICEVVKHTLESCGYRVLTAHDGREAIEIFRQRQNEIEVVITDMMMPYLDGPATIRALKEIDPRVRIIATSGIRSTGKLAEAAQSGVNIFLSKPFTADQMLSTLAQVINQEE